MRQAAKAGTKLIVFPEAFIPAYPKGLDFGVRVGTRSDEGRALYARYHAEALDPLAGDFDLLCEAAKETGVFLVIGIIEREGGTLYCSILYIDETGNVRGKHRKIMPTAMERVIWGAGDGSSIKTIDTSFGKIGGAICWENYMPLLRQRLYEDGVQIYCMPTVDDRETWQSTVRHVAREGRCFVLSCCQYMVAADCPPDYPADAGASPEGVCIKGGSCVADPLGNWIIEPTYGKKDVLYAELDLSLIVKAQFDFDIVGHYVRKDVFKESSSG